jgi:trans-aconitate 2-methyltransferase
VSAMNSGPREWDAEVYDRVSDPQFEWSREVVERLAPRPGETILDAGCGSGRVTEELVDAGARVIAVDASEGMVEMTREKLGDRVDARVADLAELELSEQVDAVFSNAVFHWVLDHERLFARMHAALKPGGRLVAQCGGKGNVAALRDVLVGVAADERFEPHFRDFAGMWNFAGPEETSERVRGAGFEDVSCWLQDKKVRPEEPDAFVRTVTLGPHLARLPGELHDPFVAAVLDGLGDPVELGYVRLNINARRPAPS